MLPITFRILRIPTRDCSILCLVKTNLVKSRIYYHQSEKMKRGSHLFARKEITLSAFIFFFG